MKLEGRRAVRIEDSTIVVIISEIFNIRDCGLQVAIIEDSGRMSSCYLEQLQLISDPPLKLTEQHQKFRFVGIDK